MESRLLVSLSGASDATLPRMTDIVAELDRRGVGVSLLVRPRACAQSGLVTAWVKTRARYGDSVLMHGYDHGITPSHRPVWPGVKAEFAGLPAHEAGLRLKAAVAALERVDLPVDGFAPPRWLASRGTLTALRRNGFTLCADAAGIHHLRTGELQRARVHTLAAGQPNRTETLRCFALVLAVARAARRGGLIRVGADVADLARPGPRQALLDAVDVAVEAGAAPSTYRRLVTGEGAGQAA